MSKCMKYILLLMLLTLVLILIDQYSQEETEIINDPLQVYFCPREDCLRPFMEILNRSTSSIHCALYDLTSPEIASLLQEKSKTEEVKLVIDEHNTFPGAKKVPKDKTMHNKFCIIDRTITTTGSLNPTPSGFEENNNNFLIVHSKRIAANYEDEFKELFAGKFDGGEKTAQPIIRLNNETIETYFCPEDECEKKVVGEVSNAKESILFMTFSFTSSEISDAIVLSGVPYRGIFEKSQISDYSEYTSLKNVRVDGNPSLMHHKVFIIDNATVITGSFNPTQNGNAHNDENIMIIHDAELAKKYVNEFEMLWREAKESNS